MVEWSITTVLKTVVLRGTGGSNPSLSANKSNLMGCSFFCICEPGSHVLSVAPLGESVPSGRARIPLSPQTRGISFSDAFFVCCGFLYKLEFTWLLEIPMLLLRCPVRRYLWCREQTACNYWLGEAPAPLSRTLRM